MLSDATIADAILALYEYPNGPKLEWDHREHPKHDDGVSWALKRFGDIDLVVLRGSVTLQDWFRDFEWIANPLRGKQIGPVHPGFFDGCDEAWASIAPMLRKPYNYILCGHSLGGAHVSILTAFGVLERRPPIRRLTFGEPRAGFDDLREIIKGVPSTMYRNKHDLISHLPFAVGPWQYVDSGPVTEINVRPFGLSLWWGPFAPHHMTLYRAALNSKGETA